MSKKADITGLGYMRAMVFPSCRTLAIAAMLADEKTTPPSLVAAALDVFRAHHKRYTQIFWDNIGYSDDPHEVQRGNAENAALSWMLAEWWRREDFAHGSENTDTKLLQLREYLRSAMCA